MDTIIKSGPAPTTSFGTALQPLVVDSTFGAGRVVLKPDEFNFGSFNGGHFRAGQVSGALTGAGAASTVFSMRWALSPGLFLLKRLSIGLALTTAFTAGQLLDYDVVRVSNFTAADTGGTSLLPFSTGINKKRTQTMSNAQVSDMRISSTAALAAGTKTQDANPFGFTMVEPINLAVPTATAQGGFMPMVDLYVQNENAEYPQMFGNNEGFNIRNITAMGAAGVIKLYVVVDWAEVPNL